MAISNDTKERIAQDAEDKDRFWGNQYEHEAFQKGYIAGGEAEAERAGKLLMTLETIKAITESPVMPSFRILRQLCKIATEALANYNSKPVK